MITNCFIFQGVICVTFVTCKNNEEENCLCFPTMWWLMEWCSRCGKIKNSPNRGWLLELWEHNSKYFVRSLFNVIHYSPKNWREKKLHFYTVLLLFKNLSCETWYRKFRQIELAHEMCSILFYWNTSQYSSVKKWKIYSQ